MDFQEAKEISLRIAKEMTRLFRELGYEVMVEGECNISGAIGCFIGIGGLKTSTATAAMPCTQGIALVVEDESPL
jgi:hypothetical protein